MTPNSIKASSPKWAGGSVSRQLYGNFNGLQVVVQFSHRIYPQLVKLLILLGNIGNVWFPVSPTN
jgi:hypothetical protein